MNLALREPPARDGAGGPFRVLLVDDSATIRGLLRRAVENERDIAVVGSVGNGKQALEALGRNDPEIVVLDIEMPEMDGLTALPLLVAKKPGLQVLMASTLTRRNAEISLKAMSMGAADYVAKPGVSALVTAAEFNRELLAKVRALGTKARRLGSLPLPSPRAAEAAAPAAAPAAPTKFALRNAPNGPFEAITIAASTGGPQAVPQVLMGLKGVGRPIFITQHMPATFTAIFAEHLARQTGLAVAEAVDGEPVRADRVYLAPGDFHMTLDVDKRLRITKGAPENFCRPAADPMLRSLSAVYGRKLLTIVLTGMGHDGLEGGRRAVEAGGALLAQDEASSVVWGMPGAVATAGICCAVLPLRDIAPRVRKLMDM